MVWVSAARPTGTIPPWEKLPFPVQQIQSDNGAEFGSAFHWHLLDKGVRHLYIKPATPRLNGKVCELM